MVNAAFVVPLLPSVTVASETDTLGSAVCAPLISDCHLATVPASLATMLLICN